MPLELIRWFGINLIPILLVELVALWKKRDDVLTWILAVYLIGDLAFAAYIYHPPNPMRIDRRVHIQHSNRDFHIIMNNLVAFLSIGQQGNKICLKIEPVNSAGSVYLFFDLFRFIP
jgi:hypothetical protein